MNRAGVDPAAEKLRVRLEAERLGRATFRQAMSDYVAWLPERKRNRNAKKDQGTLTREFHDPQRNPWIDKPLREVTGVEVQRVIEAIRDRPAAASGYEAFGLLKRFFEWVIAPKRRAELGVMESPLTKLTNEEMKLQKNKRHRKHDADEVRAYWARAETTAYPWGEYFKALMLTGQRNRDVRLVQWCEFDLEKRTWTIPAVRFKSDRDELVMLSVPVIQLLDRIKRRQSENHGPFVFSTTDGWKPIQGVSKATEVFRKRMGEIYAEKHGKPMKHWVPACWPCASGP